MSKIVIIILSLIGFEVLTAVTIHVETTIFWDVTKCSVEVFQRFRGTCCFRSRHRKVSQESKMYERNSNAQSISNCGSEMTKQQLRNAREINF
jgi:hypothetical protein